MDKMEKIVIDYNDQNDTTGHLTPTTARLCTEPQIIEQNNVNLLDNNVKDETNRGFQINTKESVLQQPIMDEKTSVDEMYFSKFSEGVDMQMGSENVVTFQPDAIDTKSTESQDHFPAKQSGRGATRYDRDTDEICCLACLVGCQESLRDVVECLCCRLCCRNVQCCQCETENESCEYCGDSCLDCECCCENCNCDCLGPCDGCCDGFGSCCLDIFGGIGECLGGCVAGLLTGCFS